jgi:hypothetical protein
MAGKMGGFGLFENNELLSSYAIPPYLQSLKPVYLLL